MRRFVRNALALAGLVAALWAPIACSRQAALYPQTSVAQVERSLPGFHPSEHFMQRLAERGVALDDAVQAVKQGRRFYDPKNESDVYWRDGVYVATTPSGVLKTVIRGPIERRWIATDEARSDRGLRPSSASPRGASGARASGGVQMRGP